MYRQSEKMLNSNTSSTCPYNMVNFGLLAAEISWRVWGTPANFNGFRVLATLLHGTLVVGVSQTCGVDQRASSIFGRAAITLGIGPHSSYFFFLSFFMVVLWNRADHYIFIVWFLLLSFFFFPRLISAVADCMDVCHTSTHGVALVRTYDVGLKRAARGLLKIQDAK